MSSNDSMTMTPHDALKLVVALEDSLNAAVTRAAETHLRARERQS